MSAIIYGVQFAGVPGFYYAPESATPGIPGVFTLDTEYPRDKDGNLFVTGQEYRYYYRQGLNNDPVMMRFQLDAFGQIVPIDGVPDELKPPTLVKSPVLKLTDPVATGQALTVQVLPDQSVSIVNSEARQDTPGLNEVLGAKGLPASRRGKGGIYLEEGTSEGLPGIWLSKKISGYLTSLVGLIAEDDATASITLFGKRIINFDATTTRFGSLYNWFSGRLGADKIGIRSPPEFTNPDSAVFFQYSNETARYELGSFSKANMQTWLGVSSQMADWIVTSLKFKNPKVASVTPGQFLILDSSNEVLAASAAQLADALYPYLKPRLLSDIAAGGGSVSALPIQFIGCKPENKKPSQQQELLLDHVVPGGAWMHHNLQTTQENIGVSEVWVFNPAAAPYWVRDSGIDQLLEFQGSSQVRITAGAAGYKDVKVRILLKRMN